MRANSPIARNSAAHSTVLETCFGYCRLLLFLPFFEFVKNFIIDIILYCLVENA